MSQLIWSHGCGRVEVRTGHRGGSVCAWSAPHQHAACLGGRREAKRAVGMDGGWEGGGVGRRLSTVFLQTLNSDSNVSEPPTGDQTR